MPLDWAAAGCRLLVYRTGDCKIRLVPRNSGLASKQTLKSRCSVALQRGQDMRIDIAGDAHRRVAQHLAPDRGVPAS